MAIAVFQLEDDTEESPVTSDGGVSVRRWRGLHANQASLDYLIFQPGAEPLHLRYPAAEDSFYVLRGEGTVSDMRLAASAIRPGQFIHVVAGQPHQLQARGSEALILLGGPCPPGRSDLGGGLMLAGLNADNPVRVLDIDRSVEVPLINPPMPGTYVRFPIWPGMGAQLRSMNYVIMHPGQENVPHIHPFSEDIFFCISGTCVIIDGDRHEVHPFGPDSLIFVDPGTTHAVRSLGPDDYVSVGGACPPDLLMFRRFGLVS